LLNEEEEVTVKLLHRWGEMVRLKPHNGECIDIIGERRWSGVRDEIIMIKVA
jgi:SOS-response transcriptional repressor LexA